MTIKRADRIERAARKEAWGSFLVRLLKTVFAIERCKYCFKRIHRDTHGHWSHGWKEWKTCHPKRICHDLPEEFAAPNWECR
jgi:hypothetical protein